MHAYRVYRDGEEVIVAARTQAEAARLTGGGPPPLVEAVGSIRVLPGGHMYALDSRTYGPEFRDLRVGDLVLAHSSTRSGRPALATVLSINGQRITTRCMGETQGQQVWARKSGVAWGRGDDDYRPMLSGFRPVLVPGIGVEARLVMPGERLASGAVVKARARLAEGVGTGDYVAPNRVAVEMENGAVRLYMADELLLLAED